jgi:nicotinic acid mononucleotide adenylyltransferase
MHWKIKRDPYYAELWPILGDEGLKEAGFFEDSSNIDYPIEDSLLCPSTPLYFQEVEQAQKPAFLVSTGAFSPLHPGHLEMMEKAKAFLQSKGYQVIAGYLSPGHDEYIREKLGAAAIPIHKRIAFIQDQISSNPDYHWLRVDPWEGIFAPVAVNFTEVLWRLEQLIEAEYGRKTPVFYVCGGDNARFALSFLKKGYAVIVGRPEYEDRFEHYQKQFKDSDRIFFVEGNHEGASTKVRSNWEFKLPQPKGLRLRISENDKRTDRLIQLLAPYFSNIQICKLEAQKEHFETLDQTKMISLDPLLPARYNLAISRIYDRFGMDLIGYGPRPSCPSLLEQLKKIPKGKYILFDDDQSSGGTIHFAKQLLNRHGIEITQVLTLENTKEEFSEILDARDFYIGGELNGLVQQWGNDLLRLPYCYPFVCPLTRASITQPMEFSKAIWKMNWDYFLEQNQQLKALPEIWQRLFEQMGFDGEDWMSAICQRQLEALGTTDQT